MRIRLARENYAAASGAIVSEFRWPNAPLIASMQLEDGEIYVIGVITGIERDDDGWITAELGAGLDVNGMVASAFVNTSADPDEGNMIVAVLIGPAERAQWDGMEISGWEDEPAAEDGAPEPVDNPTPDPPTCSECGEPLDLDDPHAGYGMCASCLHDAERSGWTPPAELAEPR